MDLVGVRERLNGMMMMLGICRPLIRRGGRGFGGRGRGGKRRGGPQRPGKQRRMQQRR